MRSDVAARPNRAWAVDPPAARGAGLVVAGIGGLVAAVLAGAWLTAARPAAVAHRPPSACGAADRDGRALRASSAVLSAAVLLDSGIEHYRGSFKNPGMYTPLLISSVGMATNLGGGTVPRVVADGVHAAAVAAGAAGVAFHLYNVGRKPGGFGWLNLFYAAPVGAPAALALAGLIGFAATRIGSAENHAPRLAGLPGGRVLAGLTGVGLAGTVGEAGLMHFRGSFQNPFMWLPVSLPPIAAALMLAAALEPAGCPRNRWLTRAWLRLTAVLGVGGVGFHAYGVSRAMGGWRNWSQNLIDGPPLPAPPSFAALAVAGLAALRLRDREDG